MEKASLNKIKLWRKLSQKKYRSRYGLFIAEGGRCVEQILQNETLDVEALITSDELMLMPEYPDKLPVFIVSGEEMKVITNTNNPQGIAAVCKIPDEPEPDQVDSNAGIIVAADGIQDPGNLGTIIRTASWFGASALLAGTGTVDPWNPKVVRSTAGATGTLPVISGDLDKLLAIFEKKRWQVYLLDGSDSSEELKRVEKNRKSILIAGNEANGISDPLYTDQRQQVKISGRGDKAIESLNAAIALSITLFHFFDG